MTRGFLAVTSESYDGTLGGLSGADSECENLMDDAYHDGTWRALVSGDSTDAKARVTVKGIVRNPNGSKVADGASDLSDETLDAAVGYDEKKQSVSSNVWTGSKDDGTTKTNCGLASSCTCSTWSSSTTQGGVGKAGGKRGGWFQSGNVQCTLGDVRLYCIDGQ